MFINNVNIDKTLSKIFTLTQPNPTPTPLPLLMEKQLLIRGCYCRKHITLNLLSWDKKNIIIFLKGDFMPLYLDLLDDRLQRKKVAKSRD